jgi:hypothetical protein
VLKFDHFCVFIGNTVGQANYFWFLCFVGLTSLGAIYFVLFSLFHVFHLADRLEREAGFDTGTAFGKAVGQTTLTVVVGIYFTVMGGLVTLLLLLHCYFVSTGQTTYEFMRGAWKRARNPFRQESLRGNWMAVVRNAARLRSQCDGDPTIETATANELGEYVGPGSHLGTKHSPREEGGGDGSPSSTTPVLSQTNGQIAYIPAVQQTRHAPTGRVRSAEFQLLVGDDVMSTTLSEKMLKKSLHKALLEPFFKHSKTPAASIHTVIVDGEKADVTRPALSFVTTPGVVVVQLVRSGDHV